MRRFWQITSVLAGLVATMALGVAVSGFGAFYYLSPSLPSVEEMREIPLQIPLRVYSRDGRLLDQIGEKRRSPIDYDEIPHIVRDAFLAAEDDRFFDHPGFDYQGIMRAALNMLKTGTRAQGGSTITQQIARDYFLTRDRTFVRKAKELILATQIENEFSKEEILELYLNKIFLGQRAYGVVAAASVYFGKTLDELTVAEAATLAGLPAAPSRLNPVSSAQQATERRAYVLRRMHELAFIDDEQLAAAIATPMMSRLHGPRIDLRAPYIAEMVRDKMFKDYGGVNAYTAGYQVVTTLDSTLQRAADLALRKALFAYDRRHGFRGAIDNLSVDKIIADYVADNSVDDLNADAIANLALQNTLSDYPSYGYLHAAIVLNTRTDKSAEFFLRDSGKVVVEWEKIKWAPLITDNRIGDPPDDITQMLAPGDVVYLLNTSNGLQLAQIPDAQGAFVAMDPSDGSTVALSGGFDYFASKFNRATQARRQPGSSFKPFIYSAALENGFTTSTIINDAPVVFEGEGVEVSWRPENYSNRFYGPTRMREALVKSMNLVSVRMLLKIGIGNAINHIEPFGFPKSALPRDHSLALGSGGASPWQMANGFTALANGGYSVKRYFIDKILNANGEVVFQAEPMSVFAPCEDVRPDEASEDANDNTQLEETQPPTNAPRYASVAQMIEQAGQCWADSEETPEFWQERNQPERIITAENSYIVYDMMRDVIQRGTGRRARELGRKDLAGKTGTSNNRRDAWFSGFNSELVGVAWVGFDEDSRSLGAGEEGSRTALPMWKNFMAVALKNSPEAPLKEPQDLVTVRVSADTGQLATTADDTALFEIFVAGTEPEAAPEDYGYAEADIFVEQGGDDSSIF